MERWQLLLDEAWRPRYQPERPAALYRFSWQRMRAVLAFIRYVRERGGRALDAMTQARDQVY